jgi:Protein of unknown function (DUF2946)
MKREAAAWAAILSIALNSLWPLIATVSPAPTDPTGTVVCTAHGMVAVFDADLQLPGPAGPTHRLTPHCAFCSLGAAHAALASASAFGLAMELPADEVPHVYRFAPPRRFPSSSLRSRAPPAWPSARL